MSLARPAPMVPDRALGIRPEPVRSLGHAVTIPLAKLGLSPLAPVKARCALKALTAAKPDRISGTASNEQLAS